MVRNDIDKFLASIPKDVTIVAATKYVNSSDLKVLLQHGINNFGENRVENFLEKFESLKNEPNVVWHFIGHLQRNKAKKVLDKIDYLHSLDSLELAKIIDEKRTSPLKCFVEVSINLEESKNGVPYYELENFLNQVKTYKNVQIVGLMMMSVKYSDEASLNEQFRKLIDLKNEMENKLNIKLPLLSMGMSGDYKEAINAGATHIRLGRILFDIEY